MFFQEAERDRATKQHIEQANANNTSIWEKPHSAAVGAAAFAFATYFPPAATAGGSVTVVVDAATPVQREIEAFPVWAFLFAVALGFCVYLFFDGRMRRDDVDRGNDMFSDSDDSDVDEALVGGGVAMEVLRQHPTTSHSSREPLSYGSI